jgi:hypothetical protein
MTTLRTKKKATIITEKRKVTTMTMTRITTKKKRKGQTRCINKSRGQTTINHDSFCSVEGGNADRECNNLNNNDKQ